MYVHTSLLFTLPWDNPLISWFDAAKVTSMCAVYLRRKKYVQKKAWKCVFMTLEK